MGDLPIELKLSYDVGKYIFHGHNPQTGFFAIQWASDNTITLYEIGKQHPTPRTNMSEKSWNALRMVCKIENKETRMYRYGKSRIVHYGLGCVKNSARHDPVTISILNAALEGYTPCKNCYYRNRCRDR